MHGFGLRKLRSRGWHDMSCPLEIESLLRPQVYGLLSALSRKAAKLRQILTTTPLPGRKVGQSLPIDPDDNDDCSDSTGCKE